MHNESRTVAEDVTQDPPSSEPGADEGLVAPVDLANAPVSMRLRAAREALGLTTDEVARRTRITLRHIEALEAGDYAALPGRPYALGFARGYAVVVGLDGKIVADAVRLELAGSAPRPEPRILHQFEVGDPDKTPSRLVGWLAVLLLIAVLALGAVFWRGYFVPAVSLPSLAGPAEPAPAGQDAAGQDAEGLARRQASASGAGPAAAISGGTVIVTAVEEGIWVKFYDGQGKQLMQKQLAKGESYTVPADAISPKLWTGRPDALAITIGGQAVARLAETEKVVKDVPVDAASLRARPPTSAPAVMATAASSPVIR